MGIVIIVINASILAFRKQLKISDTTKVIVTIVTAFAILGLITDKFSQ